MVKQDVLGLQVSMHDSYLMNVLYAGDYLLIVLAGLVFLETLRLPDLLEELVPAAVLHD